MHFSGDYEQTTITKKNKCTCKIKPNEVKSYIVQVSQSVSHIQVVYTVTIIQLVQKHIEILLHTITMLINGTNFSKINIGITLAIQTIILLI